MEDAVIISEILKETWKAHINSDLRWRLDNGLGNLLAGKTDDAMLDFAALVKDDPSYGESWNKLSTCEFMLGKLEASLESAQKTLDLIPTHYQALNGMGLVHYERNDISLATEHFQKSLELDPWSPVSSRLATCLDALQSETDSAAAKR
jgi:tetratricopeptide (TPR) repeat protein